MHFSKKTIALLAASASFVSAMPAATNDTLQFEPGVNSTIHAANAQGWATFCTDTKCSEGCGISVSLNNPGCLHEPRARSVKIHDGIYLFDRFNLIVSPGDGCRCQTDCIGQVTGDSNECYNLDNHKGGSYRFITADGCDEKKNVC